MVIVLAGLVICASFALFPRQLPLEKCSREYLRYKDVEGIKASFVKDFPVNDTLAVDVTLLQATDSLGWEILKKDFNIVDPSPQAFEMMKHTKCSVGVRRTPRDNIGAPCDTAHIDNNIILTVDNLEHSIGIFYTRDKYQREHLFNYHLDNFKTPQKHEQNI